jgi:hypothetical protein
MADILFFPTERALAAAHRLNAPPQAEIVAADVDAGAWSEADAADNGSLERVASLAATPSQSLAVLAAKMEVLVARLAPDDGADAGLCIAEVNLLRSVLCDLRAFVMDVVFAAQGADQWAPVSTRANLMQGTVAS